MPILELPIFPLPLVLFPGASQLLHIFEPRYREMLADCMKGDQRFGISWVDPQGKEDPAPDPGSVGCVAEVRASTALADGRSNILTVGEERYTLLSYLDRQTPYRVGRVETFADHPESHLDTAELTAKVSHEFRAFAAAMSALTDSMSNAPEMAEDPMALSFQVAAALEIEGKLKQELLITRSTRQRLEMLHGILRSVVADLGPRAEVHVRARKNGKGGANASIVQGG